MKPPSKAVAFLRSFCRQDYLEEIEGNLTQASGGFAWKGMDPGYIAEFGTFTVTPQYGRTLGWRFVDGRDFSIDRASDSSAFVINEAAAKILGFENPIGEIVQWQSWWTRGRMNFTIIGVIKDQVMKSPYDPAMPSVFSLGGSTNWLAIRLNSKMSVIEALPKLEGAFKNVLPAVPFEYKFADQEYELKFAAEERIGLLVSLFAILAIFISSLGLFGLASFVAEQRTKEIGIRKIVGASVFALWKMISQDFVVLVTISCVFALPAGYFLMELWLNKFDYRTDIPLWILFATGFAAIVLTLLTVSYQAIRAATVNPVNSLRSE